MKKITLFLLAIFFGGANALAYTITLHNANCENVSEETWNSEYDTKSGGDVNYEWNGPKDCGDSTIDAGATPPELTSPAMFKFMGWKVDENKCSDVTLTSKNYFVPVELGGNVNSDVELWPIWKKAKPIKLHYDKYSLSFSLDRIAADDSLLLPTFKDLDAFGDRIFCGWFKNEDFSGREFISVNTKTMGFDADEWNFYARFVSVSNQYNGDPLYVEFENNNPTFSFTGSAHRPKIIVKDYKKQPLIEGYDYIVEYSDNIYPGEAKATVKWYNHLADNAKLKPMTKNFTIKGKTRTPKKYTLNLFYNPASIAKNKPDTTIEYRTDTKTWLPTLTNKTDTFLGWCTKQNCNESETFRIIPANTTVNYQDCEGNTCNIYAKWGNFHSCTLMAIPNNKSFGSVKITDADPDESKAGGIVVHVTRYQKVKLKAEPRSKYFEFVRWSDGETNPKREVIVTDHVEYVAEFKQAEGMWK